MCIASSWRWQYLPSRGTCFPLSPKGQFGGRELAALFHVISGSADQASVMVVAFALVSFDHPRDVEEVDAWGIRNRVFASGVDELDD